MDKDLLYKIGLTFIDHVGHITSKVLISYCGSAEAVFKEMKQNLLKIPDIGEITAPAAADADFLARRLGVVGDQHPATAFARLDGAHHAGGSGADHHNVEDFRRLRQWSRSGSGALPSRPVLKPSALKAYRDRVHGAIDGLDEAL